MINLTTSPPIRGPEELDDVSSELRRHPRTSAQHQVLTYRLLCDTLVTHLYRHSTFAHLFAAVTVFFGNISSAPRVIFLFLQSNGDTLRLHHGTSLSRRHSHFPYLRLDGFDEPKPPICIIIKLRPPHLPHPIQLFSNGITESLLLCDPVLAVRSVLNAD